MNGFSCFHSRLLKIIIILKQESFKFAKLLVSTLPVRNSVCKVVFPSLSSLREEVFGIAVAV